MSKPPNDPAKRVERADKVPAKQPVGIVCGPLYTVGGLAMVAGLLLWLGNLSGFVPTFRGSGFVVIVLGCILWHLGVYFPLRRPFRS